MALPQRRARVRVRLCRVASDSPGNRRQSSIDHALVEQNFLGAGLRIGIWIATAGLIIASVLRAEERWAWYHSTAIAIAAGQGLQLDGVPTAYRPPGYSALLALTYRLFGPYPEWAWFWGVASTGIILLTTYRLADRLYGETIARIATLIIALYPALILYTGQPMSDLVFTAGLMLVWYVVTLHPPYRWLETIGIGVAAGTSHAHAQCVDWIASSRSSVVVHQTSQCPEIAFPFHAY